MARTPFLSDKLDLLFQRVLSRRELIWLRMMLEDCGFDPSDHNADSHDLRREMTSFIKMQWWDGRGAPYDSWADPEQWKKHRDRDQSLRTFWNEIGTYLDQRLLDVMSFDWIAETGRQPSWLLKQLSQPFSFTDELSDQSPKSAILYRNNVAGLSEKETLIARLDYQSSSSERKLLTVDRLREDWNRKLIGEQPFSWYTKDSHQERQKCECAWLWYSNRREPQRRRSRQPSKLHTLEDVLTHIDDAGYSLEEALYHLEQIKKKFKAQQVAAKRKGKKQTNLSLSDDARKKLDALSKKEKMTRTELIELLIENAHEHGVLG